jgi:hypothetical protein
LPGSEADIFAASCSAPVSSHAHANWKQENVEAPNADATKGVGVGMQFRFKPCVMLPF